MTMAVPSSMSMIVPVVVSVPYVDDALKPDAMDPPIPPIPYN